MKFFLHDKQYSDTHTKKVVVDFTRKEPYPLDINKLNQLTNHNQNNTQFNMIEANRNKIDATQNQVFKPIQ